MLNTVAISGPVRVAFDPRFPIEGVVLGVERDEQDGVAGLLVAADSVPGGTIYFTAEDLLGAEVSVPSPAASLQN